MVKETWEFNQILFRNSKIAFSAGLDRICKLLLGHICTGPSNPHPGNSECIDPNCIFPTLLIIFEVILRNLTFFIFIFTFLCCIIYFNLIFGSTLLIHIDTRDLRSIINNMIVFESFKYLHVIFSIDCLNCNT